MSSSRLASPTTRSPTGKGSRAVDLHLLRAMLVIIIVFAAILAARVVYIQLIGRDHFLQVAAYLNPPDRSLPGQPGAIRDRKGRIMADSVVTASVKVDPQLLRQHEDVAAASHRLSEILGLSLQEVEQIIGSDRNFAYLKRRIPLDLSNQIMAQRLTGISRDLEYKRIYPQAEVGCHLLGYFSSDHRPLAGLEYQYRFVLQGRKGTPLRNRDAWGRTIVGMEDQPAVPPAPGKDLVLTVDLDLQRVVDDALGQCWERERPDQATALVMDPNTGDILALASRPNYDPNRIASADTGVARVDISPNNLRNLPVSREYEPGSTFKVLLVAAALETGAVGPKDTFFCPGVIELGGKPLKCWGRWARKGHERLDMAGMIAKSCNICAALTAKEIGARRYVQFLQRCGIGAPTKIGLPAEAAGKLQQPSAMRIRDVANMGFGQNVAVTDVQLVAAISAVVNGGVLMQSHIVDRVLNSDGSTYRRVAARPIRRVCSEKTSQQVRRLMEGAVEGPGATGRTAHIPGVAVGGKTGTAQIWDTEHQQYRPDEHMVSFVLVAPVDSQPEFVILVTVRDPKKGQHGADVAGPVARQIAVYMLKKRDLIPAEALSNLGSS